MIPEPQRATSVVNALTPILARQIASTGPMTFAAFMEQCLYHPEHGYYTRGRQKHLSDYYTSVDVHPIFARLLARQFAEMWEALGRPKPFTVVECGAGSGDLSRQMLAFSARALPEFHDALLYKLVERSEARRAIARTALRAYLAEGKCAIHQALPDTLETGCIFSNELLDAMPVHRVRRTSGELQELYVEWRDGRFVDSPGPLSTPRLAEYFARQQITLPEGATAEVCLDAADWICNAGRALDRGFVLTIDYGHEARHLYNERHAAGTLLAYREHRVQEDYYAHPGEQDLTAHVNFTALDVWGQTAGLSRLGLVSQAHFLVALGRENEFADLYDEAMSETERIRARLKLKTLIHPEGIGEAFSVMIQGKNTAAVALTGLAPL